MRKREVVLAFIVVVFMASLLLSVSLVQAFSGAFTETRRSVLTSALENCRGSGLDGFVQSSDILTSLKILGVQNGSAVDAALQLISSKQNPVDGGYVADYGYKNTSLGADLASTYYAIHALKILDALDRINRTLLIDFVLARYDNSSGAFRELTTEAFNRSFAWCAFALVFHGNPGDAPYAMPNVIDTFFGVSILKDLNALSPINVTRTLQWVVSDQASDGGFKPCPYAEPQWNPYWSSFTVDYAGAGIPYTYVATGILKALDATDLVNTMKARDYILSCQYSYEQDPYDYGRFAFYYGDTQDTYDLYYTYYAILALRNLGMVNETNKSIVRVNDIILADQQLGLENSWPAPTPQDLNETYWAATSSHPQHTYGLFMEEEDILEGTEWGLEILNATGGLALLNQATPRVLASLLDLIELSALISMLALIIAIVTFRQRKTRNPQQ